ncbi:extensin family protein [Sphingomonas rhizophila]|uniref:extensin-like domain-containing protein n=1 Tax=Sphingomonas rhizophila TaxID=2071607 RepID=UPI001FE6373F|nr:extensin family protein [Sphingomonas rhizophila]
MPERRRGPRWGCLLLLVTLVIAGILGWREYQRQVREHPERFPWTPLSLSDPVGRFTSAKLVGLREDADQCRVLLSAVGDRAQPVPPRMAASSPSCGYLDGVRQRRENEDWATYGDLVTSCPVAAALRLWERTYVQPAAERIFGHRVARIDHFGSYSCRRLYGRTEGGWSEHATANAVDIAGFRLTDGRRISVLADWSGSPDEAAFLRTVRDGACQLFATTLSPDYNAAHRDHLHLDLANRGQSGWRMCR